MTKSIVACLEDLFFRSKIDATARHLALPVRFVDVDGLVDACGEPGTAAALVELNDGVLEAVRRLRQNKETLGLSVIGFLSHVDKALAQRAEEAGTTRVMPRSQFSENLPELLMDLMAPGTHREVQEEPELPDE